MNYTYIVRCADDTLYTGWTNDLNNRLKAHNEGRGARYTRPRRPVELVYYEAFPSKAEAMSREYAIKKLTRRQKESLCNEGPAHGLEMKLSKKKMGGNFTMTECTTQTKYGKIQGVQEDGCIIFKGVPYAKPPVGELRWRAPQKPEPWEGIYMADTYPNRSAQMDRQDDVSIYKKEFYEDEVYATPTSEDSLYLNIWVPEKAYDHPLPVAFYIHGGAFMGGTGHELEFRTNAYAKKDVILITINYRLGVLGFLAHPWLTAEDDAACGNYGIMDQIAALDWVQENIAAFGGDPENVTIFGQSAGCMSVQTLLSTDYAKGKFAKAILQSGAGYPVTIQRDIPLELGYEFGEKVAKAAGAASLEELRCVPVEKLYEIQGNMMMEMMMSGKGLAFTPVRNGIFRTETYDALAEKGLTADVPTMIGSTRKDITVTEDEAKEGYSQFQKNCVGWALQMEKVGHKPSYVYHFTRDLPGDDAGAFHSSELWYMFGTLGQCWRPMTDGDFALSERMVSYWTNFMKNSDPNGEGLPVWKTCTGADPFEMVLDVEV